MNPRSLMILVICVPILLLSANARGQDAEILFKNYCATCHDAADSLVPTRDVLRQMRPEQAILIMVQ